MLHEAGHLAVMTPKKRAKCGDNAGKNIGEEIGAICWSYAALTHLGLDPTVVFHPQGYKGVPSRSLTTSVRDASSACPCCNGWE